MKYVCICLAWCYAFTPFSAAQSPKWTTADTAQANQLCQIAYELTNLDDPMANDSAWMLFDRVLDIYGSTVGLYFEAPYDALRMKALIRYYQSDFRAAIPIYHQCIEVGRRVHGPRGKPLGSSYDYLGASYGQIGEFDLALKYSRESLETRLIHLSRYHFRVAETYNNIAVAQHFRGDLSGAIDNYLEAIEIHEHMLKSGTAQDSLELINAYHNIHVSLLQHGDSERAMGYLYLALQALSNVKTHPGINSMRGLLLRDLGSVYSKMGDEAKSIQYYEQAIAHYQSHDLGFTPEVGLTYSNLANTCSTVGDFSKAEQYLKKALQVWDTISQYELPGTASDIHFIAHALKTQAETEIRKGDFPSAQKHSFQALKWAKQFSNYEVIYPLHLLLADLYNRLGRADSAEYHYLQACGGPGWQAAQTFWSAGAAPGALALFHFRQAQQAGNLTAMQQAWQEWQKFELSLLTYRNRLDGDKPRAFLINQVRPYIEAALSAAQDLYSRTQDKRYLGDAFKLSENIRALALLESIQKSKALRFGNIPDSLLTAERNLQLDIAWLEKQLFLEEQSHPDKMSAAYLDFSARLARHKKQVDALKQTFEARFPDYYRLKYAVQGVQVQNIQEKLLSPETAMVKYFVGDSTLYIFTVQKKEYALLKIKKDFPLETWVAQLRKGLTAFHTDPGMGMQYDSLAQLYVDAAHRIYQKLIAPVTAELPRNVVFVPDGVLGYVPFDALLVEKPANPARWNSHHYLLQDHTASYCYSATLLREMHMRVHPHPPSLPFSGFAPKYTGDTALIAKLYPYSSDMRKWLGPLPNSGEEVYRSARILGGQAHLGAEATEERFIALAGQARILHLATHGQANDRSGDYSFLVFEERKDSLENELLYARDIYNLQLNADLVTLSACETGIGELRGSEGIISLARAFAYAGAKSLLTSLWSISDAKTKDLMLDFYRNIKKGQSKDRALRQAKLDYLKKYSGLAAHPFFWAGFIAIGDMAPIQQ